MLECSDGDSVGKTKQLKQKLQELYNDHIFLSMLKGMRTLFALEAWLSTSLTKNYSPLRTALKTKLGELHKLTFAKFIRDEILEKKDCKSYPSY